MVKTIIYFKGLFVKNRIIDKIGNIRLKQDIRPIKIKRVIIIFRITNFPHHRIYPQLNITIYINDVNNNEITWNKVTIWWSISSSISVALNMMLMVNRHTKSTSSVTDQPYALPFIVLSVVSKIIMLLHHHYDHFLYLNSWVGRSILNLRYLI
jgi:hypothetical protein